MPIPKRWSYLIINFIIMAQNVIFTPAMAFTIDGNTEVIQVSRKNFKTGEIIYMMESGKEFTEPFLLENKLPVQSVIEQLSQEYFIKFGKKVPNGYKTNEEWIRRKVTEGIVIPVTKEIVKEVTEVPEQKPKITKIELEFMTEEEVSAFIIDENLPINPDDYIYTYEVIDAICKHLGL